MDYVGTPKMSLVAQYDDLCRYTKVLTEGCEEEFKIFVEGQLGNLRNWKEAEKEIEVLQKKVCSLDNEKKRLETQIKHIRYLCEQETNKRKKVEEEKKSMESQINLIKEVLLADGNALDNQTKEKLVFLSSTCKPMSNLETIAESTGSLLSISDDQTENDFESETSSDPPERRSREKRQSSEKQISAKKRKSQEKDFSEEVPYASVLPRNYRSSSEPAKDENKNVVRPAHKSDSGQFASHTFNPRRSSGSLTGSTPKGRYSTGGKLSRMHAFCSKTVIRAEKCNPCGRFIKFCKQALKCQDCRLTCHPECKDQCPLPCVPTTYTPTKKNIMGTIADYVSTTPPMIPSLIIHCLNEIELRGMNEVGLYRVPGSDREVKDLMQKFLRSKNVPILNQYDIHAICSTVKEFLRTLKESLMTRSSWQAIMDIVDISDTSTSLNMLFELVGELPQPNKDTLAFLMLHLQRVAENPQCKMPAENLAKVFGPTVVGYSTEDPSESKLWNETAYQSKAMLLLLSIPSDYWQNLLNIEPDVCMDKFMTPERAPEHSMLGPLISSSERRNSMQLERSPLTPRTSYRYPKRKEPFFVSPLLK